MESLSSPDWVGPPRVVGGEVGGPLPIARNDRVVVVVRDLRAYPTGFELTVEGHLRSSSARPEHALELLGDHDDLVGDALDLTDGRGISRWRERFDGPRFGVQFSDGRATVLGDASGARGDGPMMIVRFSERSSGGPDDGDDIRMSLWIWPLPPAGVVKLTCRWVIGGSAGPPLEIDLDADAIRDAAQRVEPYWLS